METQIIATIARPGPRCVLAEGVAAEALKQVRDEIAKRTPQANWSQRWLDDVQEIANKLLRGSGSVKCRPLQYEDGSELDLAPVYIAFGSYVEVLFTTIRMDFHFIFITVPTIIVSGLPPRKIASKHRAAAKGSRVAGLTPE